MRLVSTNLWVAATSGRRAGPEGTRAVRSARRQNTELTTRSVPQVAPGASPASPRSLPSGSLSGLTRPELREPWSKDTPGGAAALEVNVSKTQTRLPARARGVTSYSTGQTDNGERTEQRSELGQQHATVENAEWRRDESAPRRLVFDSEQTPIKLKSLYQGRCTRKLSTAT